MKKKGGSGGNRKQPLEMTEEETKIMHDSNNLGLKPSGRRGTPAPRQYRSDKARKGSGSRSSDAATQYDKALKSAHEFISDGPKEK